MKTRITNSVHFNDSTSIKNVLMLDDDVVIILTETKNKGHAIHKYCSGELVLSNEIDLNEVNFMDKYKSKVLFKVGRDIGIFAANENILLLSAESLKVIDIFYVSKKLPRCENGHETWPSFASADLKNSRVTCGLDGYGKIGFPPIYLTHARMTNSKEIISKNKTEYEWGELHPLSLLDYPPTYLASIPFDDFININAMRQINDRVMIHTIGGGVTNLKSGPSSEFSILSVYNGNFQLVKNYNLEEGNGIFSGDEKYFLLRPRKKTGQIYLYDINEFKLVDKISITPKQNLGENPKVHLKFDLFNSLFVLYRWDFINFCRVGFT